MIRNFGGNFDPHDDFFANGQTLSISQNTALFSLIGTTYGGNGETNFALPNLAGRLAVSEGVAPGLGFYATGQVFGSSSITLGQANLPPSSGGAATQIANEQPSLATQYVIRIEDLAGWTTLEAGEIVQFAGLRTPDGYFDCDGRSLRVIDYPELYAVLGTRYGGDGVNTFNLPDLRGRAPVDAGGPGGFALGQQVGGAAISQANLPAAMGGSGQPVSNYGPGLALNYLICVEGIYPSRDGGGSPHDGHMIGEIILYAGADLPPGFARCDGSLLNIAQNTALFSVLGVAYGGNGVNNFALPNFTGRSAVGTSNGSDVGTQAGAAAFTIGMADIPSLNIAGTAAAETLYGGDQADLIQGNDGADVLIGNGGNDDLRGGVGTDILNGGAGDDVLRGGAGQDTLNGGEGSDTYYIEAGDETDVVNEAAGAAGVDQVLTSLAGYTLAANVENLTGLSGSGQSLVGNALANVITGGSGADTLAGGAGSDTLNGGGGSDTADYGLSAAAVTIDLAAGAASGGDAQGDLLLSIENVVGSYLNDALTGDGADNRLFGNVGDDVLVGGGGADTLVGGEGRDSLTGGQGNDTLYVDAEDALVSGGDGYDVAYVTAGGRSVIDLEAARLEYVIDQAGGDDWLQGTFRTEAVTVFAGAGIDVVQGGSANDVLWGEAGNDTLVGGAGDDVLVGGTGADLMNGGAGRDQLSGGAADGAQDLFRFTLTGAANWDYVAQFEVGTDKIDLRALASDASAVAVNVVGSNSEVFIGGQKVCTVLGVTTLSSADMLFGAPAAPAADSPALAAEGLPPPQPAFEWPLLKAHGPLFAHPSAMDWIV